MRRIVDQISAEIVLAGRSQWRNGAREFADTGQLAFKLNRVRPRSVARRQRTCMVALVRAGATFINGKLVERPGEDSH